MQRNFSVPQIITAALGLNITFVVLALLSTLAPNNRANAADPQLASALAANDVTPFIPLHDPSPEVFTLGQALFFDPELSGNRDVSCATCHHPNFATGDALPLSIGVGGDGLGDDRVLGDSHAFIPRQAPELFNRNSALWSVLFWDGRVATDSAYDGINTPAQEEIPSDLTNVFAAQAMFPVTSRDEMRGAEGDLDINGQPNELAMIDDQDFALIWEALIERVLSYPEYVDLFTAAYPDIPTAEIGFEHAANAMAAFEMAAYTFTDSPWDRYVAGDLEALSAQEKRGALLFYGPAGCSSCHSGPLLTDQDFHNIAVPQFGPGKGDEAPLDYGRYRETLEPTDLYAFRTPPLRNVALTAPYMHNGAFTTLEAAVRHHLDATSSLASYDLGQLPVAYQEVYTSDPAVQARLAEASPQLAVVDPMLAPSADLTETEVQDLLAFLYALTSPSAVDLSHTIPAAVPSGLPVEK